MTKLVLIPEQSSYSASKSNQVVSVMLEGGASRTRLDKINSTDRVSVSWILNSTQYEYLMAFFRSIIAYGSLPFTMDLVLDSFDAVEYSVKLLPGSLKLSGIQGLAYFANAELEVTPLPVDLSYDDSLVLIYGLLGDSYDYFLNMLEKLTNVDLAV